MARLTVAKITKSVRMSQDTIEKLKELSVLLKEKEPELIELAINRLYNDRKEVYEQDVESRRAKLNTNP